MKLILLAAALAAPVLASAAHAQADQRPVTVVIDHRGLCSSSRVDRGRMRIAEIDAHNEARRLRRHGREVRVVEVFDGADLGRYQFPQTDVVVTRAVC
ncbi:hypothetical protein [Sphingomonas sp. BK235]|uniref:hypothetical protein n=1 Tax=Sphingomonas sp. BK235 TaxID=2512131 RepID=UPI001047853F|nr:hypothetical protein [Sphingomonas sp. BK235]TCP30686.1 hypothetical protein EV292_11243 [Sphingomonas sp. BK235]